MKFFHLYDYASFELQQGPFIGLIENVHCGANPSSAFRKIKTHENVFPRPCLYCR